MNGTIYQFSGITCALNNITAAFSLSYIRGSIFKELVFLTNASNVLLIFFLFYANRSM